MMRPPQGLRERDRAPSAAQGHERALADGRGGEPWRRRPPAPLAGAGRERGPGFAGVWGAVEALLQEGVDLGDLRGGRAAAVLGRLEAGGDAVLVPPLASATSIVRRPFSPEPGRPGWAAGRDVGGADHLRRRQGPGGPAAQHRFGQAQLAALVVGVEGLGQAGVPGPAVKMGADLAQLTSPGPSTGP